MLMRGITSALNAVLMPESESESDHPDPED
jgi:hypothetical protein